MNENKNIEIVEEDEEEIEAPKIWLKEVSDFNGEKQELCLIEDEDGSEIYQVSFNGKMPLLATVVTDTSCRILYAIRDISSDGVIRGARLVSSNQLNRFYLPATLPMEAVFVPICFSEDDQPEIKGNIIILRVVEEEKLPNPFLTSEELEEYYGEEEEETGEEVDTAEENPKYEITDETKEVDGVTVHRIRALSSFHDVAEGDFGGWISNVRNLATTGNCWVYGEAVVMGNAQVRGNVKVKDKAVVSGYALLWDSAMVFHQAVVKDGASVSGSACIGGHAVVCQDAEVKGHAIVTSNAVVGGTVTVRDYAYIGDNAQVAGDAVINAYARIDGDTIIEGKKQSDTIIGGYSHMSWQQMLGMVGKDDFAKMLSKLEVKFLTGTDEVTGEKIYTPIDLEPLFSILVNEYSFNVLYGTEMEITYKLMRTLMDHVAYLNESELSETDIVWNWDGQVLYLKAAKDDSLTIEIRSEDQEVLREFYLKWYVHSTQVDNIEITSGGEPLKITPVSSYEGEEPPGGMTRGSWKPYWIIPPYEMLKLQELAVRDANGDEIECQLSAPTTVESESERTVVQDFVVSKSAFYRFTFAVATDCEISVMSKMTDDSESCPLPLNIEAQRTEDGICSYSFVAAPLEYRDQQLAVVFTKDFSDPNYGVHTERLVEHITIPAYGEQVSLVTETRVFDESGNQVFLEKVNSSDTQKEYWDDVWGHMTFPDYKIQGPRLDKYKVAVTPNRDCEIYMAVIGSTVENEDDPLLNPPYKIITTEEDAKIIAGNSQVFEWDASTVESIGAATALAACVRWDIVYPEDDFTSREVYCISIALPPVEEEEIPDRNEHEWGTLRPDETEEETSQNDLFNVEFKVFNELGEEVSTTFVGESALPVIDRDGNVIYFEENNSRNYAYDLNGERLNQYHFYFIPNKDCTVRNISVYDGNDEEYAGYFDMEANNTTGLILFTEAKGRPLKGFRFICECSFVDDEGNEHKDLVGYSFFIPEVATEEPVEEEPLAECIIYDPWYYYEIPKSDEYTVTVSPRHHCEARIAALNEEGKVVDVKAYAFLPEYTGPREEPKEEPEEPDSQIEVQSEDQELIEEPEPAEPDGTFTATFSGEDIASIRVRLDALGTHALYVFDVKETDTEPEPEVPEEDQETDI